MDMLSGMVGLALTTMAAAPAAQSGTDFKEDYLWELAYASQNLTALAEAVPADKYAWRPGEGVRSVSEVYMHVALGSFLLLDIAGHPAPEDLYGKIPASGRERAMALVKRNGELEKSIAEKARVVELLRRSLEDARAAFTGSPAADMERTVGFFGQQKTVRAVYLRLLAHAHEHMGQSVAYARVNGIAPPWSESSPKK